LTTALGDSEPPVVVETRGDVCLLGLGRPRRRNALNWDIWEGLSDALADVSNDEGVRCVVLFGLGGFFSAGGDRNSTPARGTRALARGARIAFGLEVMRRLRELPVITVAAVEGGAIGMGWALALSCDVVILAEDAFFSAPFNELGLTPDGGLVWHLVQRVGRHRATQLLLSGERVEAQQAYTLGLATHVVAPGQATNEAIALGESIARLDPKSVDLTKRLVAEAEQSDFAHYASYELALATLMQHHRAEP
jgi:enoyl-CoA hydratase/carnithine racemase